jgi:hypothetical protein
VPSSSLARLHARASAVRTRARIRSWSYRQRNLAAGAWFRLRRVLADARAAYVIPSDDARRLVAEGYKAEACGSEVSPEKTILFVDDRALATIAARRAIPVNLGPEFLAARSIALVRFDHLR